MSKNIIQTIIVILLAGVVSSCMMLGRPFHGGMMQSLKAMPTEYKSLKRASTTSDKSISEGKDIYQKNCLSCHGVSTKGDGIVASNLNSKPANLQNVVNTQTDNYIYWRITDGGAWANSAMPSFKNHLSEEDRWKVIDFLNTMKNK